MAAGPMARFRRRPCRDLALVGPSQLFAFGGGDGILPDWDCPDFRAATRSSAGNGTVPLVDTEIGTAPWITVSAGNQSHATHWGG